MAPSDFELIDRVFCALADKKDAHGPDSIDEIEQVVLRVWHASGIIGNGGFRYFFECGLPLSATAEDYARIGVDRAAAALRELLDLFPDRRIPEEYTERLEFVDRLYQLYPSHLDRLESEYFQTDDLMEQQLAGWIRVHDDLFKTSQLS
jgi:hypothetical protein